MVPIGILCGVLAGGVLYLTHSYEALKNWYLGLFPCFYKAGEWSQTFFTPAVKRSGNGYCIAGVLIAGFLLIYILRVLIQRKEGKSYQFRLHRTDALYLSALYLFAFAFWLYGFTKCVPGYDEVFSAVNCAGIHPFQTASYYMLPNNHIFFNVLNSLVGAFTQDKLLTGRLISAVGYAALIPLLYYWLRSKTASRPFAAIFLGVMLLQFPVWGFSFQGRGYSIYLFFAWASFIFLQRYLQTGSRSALLVHGLSVIFGFWTVPTFLFWEAALGVYLLLHMIWYRKLEWAAIRAQILAGGGVFLVFLPVFCFSGLAAIMENRYVTADKVPLLQYWPAFRTSFRSTIQYCFSGFVDAHNLSYLVLFFVPLALLPFIRKSRVAGSVGFYAIMWIVFIILEVYMQRFPFMRNLTAHYSVTLAALLLSCYALLKMALADRWKPAQLALTALCCAAFAVHFYRFNRDHIYDSLYFYNSDSRYRTLHDAIMSLPGGSRVWVSDEGFYWEYLSQARGLEASMCMGPSATHYIKMETEILPPALANRVEKVRQADEYEIFRIK